MAAGSSSPTSADQERVLQALPAARALARKVAAAYRVRDRSLIQDCEQIAGQALLEASPGYDPERGPFEVYAWKRVAGAVTRHLTRELRIGRSGLSDALDTAAGWSGEADPFAEDEDALALLKAQCRELTLVRFLGDVRERLAAHPEDGIFRERALSALRAALGHMTDEEVRLIELRYWQDLSFRQVAAALGVEEKQAYRLDQRLRERLKRDLRGRHIHEPPPSEPR